MALSYDQIRTVLRDERLPAAFVDLDAFDRNLERHLEVVRARGTPLRVASKSVRVTGLLRRLLQRGAGHLRGLLCYAVEEAEFLAGEGFDDLLVAYPPFRRNDLLRVCALEREGKLVAITVDSEEGVDNAARIAREQDVTLKLVLCVDMSYRPAPGLHFGVRRSPLHSPEQVLALARKVARTPGVHLHGLMGYEAQIAGLQDANPFDPRMNPVKAAVKQLSIREVRRRRAAMVELLRANGLSLAVVNGGGVGSLDTTTPETGVTEITAGSGFFKPHLFDYYRAEHMHRLEPAAFFALEATRRPMPGMVTCLGGGYVASGSPGLDKLPLPWLPTGTKLTSVEGAGEVQTPVNLPPGADVRLGDPVIFRHAKAGELAERFREVLLIQGGAIVDRLPTYRGQGQCFF